MRGPSSLACASRFVFFFFFLKRPNDLLSTSFLKKEKQETTNDTPSAFCKFWRSRVFGKLRVQFFFNFQPIFDLKYSLNTLNTLINIFMVIKKQLKKPKLTPSKNDSN